MASAEDVVAPVGPGRGEHKRKEDGFVGSEGNRSETLGYLKGLYRRCRYGCTW